MNCFMSAYNISSCSVSWYIYFFTVFCEKHFHTPYRGPAFPVYLLSADSQDIFNSSYQRGYHSNLWDPSYPCSFKKIISRFYMWGGGRDTGIVFSLSNLPGYIWETKVGQRREAEKGYKRGVLHFLLALDCFQIESEHLFSKGLPQSWALCPLNSNPYCTERGEQYPASFALISCQIKKKRAFSCIRQNVTEKNRLVITLSSLPAVHEDYGQLLNKKDFSMGSPSPPSWFVVSSISC